MNVRTMLERALAVTPTGSQTRSKAPGHVGPPLASGLPFPLFARCGEGAYLYADDPADGKERAYLDFAGANAAVPLGYDRQEVTEAVRAAAWSGSLLSLPSKHEVEVSEAFCAATGHEMVRWVKTGSEAVSAAVRLARVYTGTGVVLYAEHSYHGWHDWTQGRHDAADPSRWTPAGDAVMENGVPMVNRGLAIPFKYANDGEGGARWVVRRVRSTGKRVAAIIMEPHRFMAREPQVEALQKLRALADEIGAVLVFDEMVYGFRWAKGGATEWCGVRPDLACYGKALGNGVPVACVAGRREVMLRAERAGISGTYGGDRIGLAAAEAVLAIHAKEDVTATLHARGRAFIEEYQTAMRHADLHLRALIECGAPVHWRFDAGQLRPGALDRVLSRCAEHGVLFHRSANNASAAMTEDEARHGARVLAEAVIAVDLEVSRG